MTGDGQGRDGAAHRRPGHGCGEPAAGPDGVVVAAAGGLPRNSCKTLAGRPAPRLSPGIRLLLHGLQGGGCPGRQVSPSGAQSKSMCWWATAPPDDEFRTRHRRHARPQDHRRSCCSTTGLRLHQPPAAGLRRGALQQSAARFPQRAGRPAAIDFAVLMPGPRGDRRKRRQPRRTRSRPQAGRPTGLFIAIDTDPAPTTGRRRLGGRAVPRCRSARCRGGPRLLSAAKGDRPLIIHSLWRSA